MRRSQLRWPPACSARYRRPAVADPDSIPGGEGEGPRSGGDLTPAPPVASPPCRAAAARRRRRRAHWSDPLPHGGRRPTQTPHRPGKSLSACTAQHRPLCSGPRPTTPSECIEGMPPCSWRRSAASAPAPAYPDARKPRETVGTARSGRSAQLIGYPASVHGARP